MISDVRIYFFNSFMLVQLLQSSYLLPSIFLKNSWINEYILIYDYFFALICLNGLVINNICLVDVVPLLIFLFTDFYFSSISCIADYRRFDKLELIEDGLQSMNAAHFLIEHRNSVFSSLHDLKAASIELKVHFKYEKA